MDQQLNVHQRDLFIDGYIAHMFDPKVAHEYHVSLLRREPGQIQFQAGTDDVGSGTFLATPPPPGSTSGQHGCVIDHAVRELGPVIRQKIWAPKKSSDKVRYVDHDQLRPPIFFIHENGRDLGLCLNDATGGDFMWLRGAEEAAPVNPSVHAQIRIKWCGYKDWTEQISIKTQTQSRQTISLKVFVKHVAKKTLKFMEKAKSGTENLNNGDDGDSESSQRFIIGDEHITPQHITLIGAVHVSHGSWMPILQLNNGYTQCLER